MMGIWQTPMSDRERTTHPAFLNAAVSHFTPGQTIGQVQP
jgi:hypothetical protein